MDDDAFYTVTAAGAFLLFAIVCGPIFPPEAKAPPAPEPAPIVAKHETPPPKWPALSKEEIKAHAKWRACMQNPNCDTFGNIVKPAPHRAAPTVTIYNYATARGTRRRHH